MTASGSGRTRSVVRHATERLGSWPVLKQLSGPDRLGRGRAIKSPQSRQLVSRTVSADRVVKSVCPYCAVGCAQNVSVKDEKIVQIEGDPDAPHSRGRLCPKGSATMQLTTGDAREHFVIYRPPYVADWERLDLETAMDMVADRVVKTRSEGWEWERDGAHTRRCMNIAALGGATLDNEENYLIKKLLTSLGIVQIENQGRVCHSSTVVGLEEPMLRNFPSDFSYVLALQEASVVAMADGYAQATQKAAVVNLHTAAGVGHAMTSILTAAQNRTPLIITDSRHVRCCCRSRSSQMSSRPCFRSPGSSGRIRLIAVQTHRRLCFAPISRRFSLLRARCFSPSPWMTGPLRRTRYLRSARSARAPPQTLNDCKASLTRSALPTRWPS